MYCASISAMQYTVILLGVQYIELRVIRHRFVHQSCQDESSGRFLLVFYMFFRSASLRCFRKRVNPQNISHDTCFVKEGTISKIGVAETTKQKPAASLFRRKHCLGAPIHIKMQSHAYNMR